jgi:hypothetical protein
MPASASTALLRRSAWLFPHFLIFVTIVFLHGYPKYGRNCRRMRG